jgi:hypothetical protein
LTNLREIAPGLPDAIALTLVENPGDPVQA